MKLGDRVIVSGRSFNGVVFLENSGTLLDYEDAAKHCYTVELWDGTVDCFKKEDVRLYDR